MISDNKASHLGTIYRLVEQFDLISRTDLAKLSDLAPASITNLSKSLIAQHFIMERAVQNSTTRGRPAVGLAISPQYWQVLCLTLSSQHLSIALCDLTGNAEIQTTMTLAAQDYNELTRNVVQQVQQFLRANPFEAARLFAVSISVAGRVNNEKTEIIRLGNQPIRCEIVKGLQMLFPCPVLLNEHFRLWLLSESLNGSLISDDDVLFLQLDDTINLSILLRGALLHKQSKMNVDTMLMPRFSSLSDEIAAEFDEITRYQLVNQITFSALARLIDRDLPNDHLYLSDKIAFFCAQAEQQNPKALRILNHITDNLAYVLMNLINIFSTKKIMLNSPLLAIKNVLFEQLSAKLRENLRLNPLEIELVTSQLDPQDPRIACAAVKQGIYQGELLKPYLE